MNPEELLDEWTDGEQTGLRPKRVQRLRDDLMDATGEYVPRSIPEIESLVLAENRRGVFTRKLKEAVDGVEAEPSEVDGDDVGE